MRPNEIIRQLLQLVGFAQPEHEAPQRTPTKTLQPWAMSRMGQCVDHGTLRLSVLLPEDAPICDIQVRRVSKVIQIQLTSKDMDDAQGRRPRQRSYFVGSGFNGPMSHETVDGTLIIELGPDAVAPGADELGVARASSMSIEELAVLVQSSTRRERPPKAAAEYRGATRRGAAAKS